MDRIRLGGIVAILVLMIYVVLNPSISFAPVPRLVLFLLASVGMAILVGAEASTKFQFGWKGFAFAATGTAALAMGILWFLSSSLKPELQVMIFDVYDEQDREVNVEIERAVELRERPTNRPGFFIARRNQLVVVFPELVSEQTVRIRKATDMPFYEGTVSYAGSRKSSLKLGTDLKLK
jgi:hypothetical protein